jgi:uncharacterized FlaG/YvyC family protein
MSRIDAVIATQVGDVARPRQAANDTHQQDLQAQKVTTQQAEQGGKLPVGSGDLRAATAQLKQVIETASGKRLSFEVDQDSDQLYVQIKDQATGEVITQIPSKDIMNLHRRLGEMLGMMVDKSA